MYYIRMLFAAAVSGTAAYSDYKTHRIKNKLTVSASLIGIASNLFFNDIGLKSSVFAFAAAFLICLPFYLLKMLRAGDIKLYMAIGAITGFKEMINCMVAGVICGGIIAVIYAMKRKCLKRRFKYLYEYLKSLFYIKKPVAYMNDDINSEGYFPFGAAIFSGIIAKIIIDLARR